MGEEQAGVDAIRTAHARIASGQSDLMLVGGAYNAERRDMLLLFELGGYLRRNDFAPVFERDDAPGLITGSAGAFLVLESAERAAARGAKVYARLSHAGAARSRRAPGTVEAALTKLVDAFGSIGPDSLAISAATGCAGITAEEAAALKGRLLPPGASPPAISSAMASRQPSRSRSPWRQSPCQPGR